LAAIIIGIVRGAVVMIIAIAGDHQVYLLNADSAPGWINTPLAVEVGLSPGDIVLDGDPAAASPFSLQEGGCSSLPNFRPMSVLAKRLDGSRRHLVWR